MHVHVITIKQGKSVRKHKTIYRDQQDCYKAMIQLAAETAVEQNLKYRSFQNMWRWHFVGENAAEVTLAGRPELTMELSHHPVYVSSESSINERYTLL